ncbi:hypothetical protein EVAR_37126_1 [Eumeta japonica]|uniref:Uncharacterized protein n=1 Tax=Eumeta variegata TaxID=151549 RepID=A0A4C1XP66_EUMVA|nr:hypothetical protein EVAR_37126_1 [Eumeta japonica]
MHSHSPLYHPILLSIDLLSPLLAYPPDPPPACSHFPQISHSCLRGRSRARDCSEVASVHERGDHLQSGGLHARFCLEYAKKKLKLHFYFRNKTTLVVITAPAPAPSRIVTRVKCALFETVCPLTTANVRTRHVPPPDRSRRGGRPSRSATRLI